MQRDELRFGAFGVLLSCGRILPGFALAGLFSTRWTSAGKQNVVRRDDLCFGLSRVLFPLRKLRGSQAVGMSQRRGQARCARVHVRIDDVSA